MLSSFVLGQRFHLSYHVTSCCPMAVLSSYNLMFQDRDIICLDPIILPSVVLGQSSLVFSVRACNTAFLRLDAALNPSGDFVEIVLVDSSQETTITDQAGNKAYV